MPYKKDEKDELLKISKEETLLSKHPLPNLNSMKSNTLQNGEQPKMIFSETYNNGEDVESWLDDGELYDNRYDDATGNPKEEEEDESVREKNGYKILQDAKESAEEEDDYERESTKVPTEKRARVDDGEYAPSIMSSVIGDMKAEDIDAGVSVLHISGSQTMETGDNINNKIIKPRSPKKGTGVRI